jgi:hypothetical protein
LVRALSKGYSKLVPLGIQQRTARAIREGMAPSIKEATGGVAKLFPYAQAFSEKLWGNPAEQANIAGMTREIEDYLRQAGWSPEEAARIAQGFRSTAGARMDPSATTAMLQAGGQRRLAAGEARAEGLEAGVRGDINTQITNIENRLGSTDPNLQQQVQQDIVKARQDFAHQASQKYAGVDRYQNEPMVPTASIKEAAQAVIDAIPREAPPAQGAFRMQGLTAAGPGAAPTRGAPIYPIPREIQALLNLPEKISFGDAQRIRSDFMKWHS